MPPRPADSHKGRFGTVLVIAGSRGMAGAAALCGASALRSGAGLVRVATPAEVQPTVASFEPCYMTYPLPDDDEGMIQLRAVAPGARAPDRARPTSWPWGRAWVSPTTSASWSDWLIESTDKPLVIDADGLNVLAGQMELLDGLTRPVILTPHPGEFARLVGNRASPQVQADRIGRGRGLAGRLRIARRRAQGCTEPSSRTVVAVT